MPSVTQRRPMEPSQDVGDRANCLGEEERHGDKNPVSATEGDCSRSLRHAADGLAGVDVNRVVTRVGERLLESIGVRAAPKDDFPSIA